MTREEAIRHIESLYPADAEYLDTAQIGEQLLSQARDEVNGWRTEPTEVLIRYAELCIERENYEAEKFIRNRRKAI